VAGVNGKAQDFARVTSSDYIPNYRKGGIKDLWTYVVDYGETPANRFVLVRGMTATPTSTPVPWAKAAWPRTPSPR
jgi:hypothetical protein